MSVADKVWIIAGIIVATWISVHYWPWRDR
jgi:hypothetical protein